MKILIATGASGGHVFPALAVADALKQQGATCLFLFGGKKFSEPVQQAGYRIITLPAYAFSGKNIFRKLWACVGLLRAFVTTVRLILSERPSVVFGTGGYATVAAVLAAKVCGVPSVIHEQNVLPGRANRMLSRLVESVLISFAKTKKYLPHAIKKMHNVGYPVRRMVRDAKLIQRADTPLQLFITGGSQGARVLSDVMPVAVALLSPELRQQLHVVHQARPEDVARTRAAYAQAQVKNAVVESFFPDLPTHLAHAHVVVMRAGAGNIGECAFLGRASILVPLRLADSHQTYNATFAEERGAAIVLEESTFTPENVVLHVQSLLTNLERRLAMEEKARTLCEPDADKTIATHILMLAKRDVMTYATTSQTL